MENSTRSLYGWFNEEVPQQRHENNDSATLFPRFNEQTSLAYGNETTSSVPPPRFENYAVGHAVSPRAQLQDLEPPQFPEKLREPPQFPTAPPKPSVTKRPAPVVRQRKPIPPPQSRPKKEPEQRQEHDTGFGPTLRCSSCNQIITREDPSFQCMECIEYEICTTCHIKNLTTIQGFNGHGQTSHTGHTFESIPARKFSGMRVQFSFVDVVTQRKVIGSRKLHWEDLVSPDGSVSDVWFDYLDAVVDYWDSYIYPGIKTQIPPQAFWYVDWHRPIELRRDTEKGLGTPAFSVLDEIARVRRLRWDRAGAEYFEVNNPNFGRGSVERTYPNITMKGYNKLLFGGMLLQPQAMYEAIVGVIRFLPHSYRQRFPPGLPKRSVFPAEPIEREMIPWASFKFPLGKKI